MTQNRTNKQIILSIAGAALALSVIAPAFAQTAQDLAEERRARQAEKQQSQQQANAPEARFPAATRSEPEAKASAKLSKKLQGMFDAHDANDSEAVLSTADEVIANPGANAYEKSISARIAGASLINADNDRALRYLQQALQFNGLSNNEHYESMLIVAQLQLQDENYADSLTTIDRFLSETESKDPEHQIVKGNALYRLKRYSEAVPVLEQAVQGAPDPDPTWQQLLMAAYAESGQSEKAAQVAEQVGNSNPNDTAAQLNLAATYLQSGQDAKAMEVLEKLHQGGKLTSEADYRNLYAVYMNAGGKEKEAISVINEGLDKGVLKQDFSTYNALGQAYWFSDQPGQAIEAWKKAAPIASNGETYLNLARALNNEGRSAEARQAAEQALAKGVNNPEDARRIIQNNR